METKPKSLRIGGHDLFGELLMKYELNPKFEKLIIQQLEKVYTFFNSNDIDRERDISNQIKKFENKLTNLKKNYGMGEIDKDIYEITKPEIEQNLIKLRSELNSLPPTLSNLENLIEQSVLKLQNISKIWGSVGYTEKQNLQKTIFPSGILYDKEKHIYLTPEINSFVVLSKRISMDYSEKEKGINQENSDLSLFVALAEPLSNHFLSDLKLLATMHLQ